MGLSILLAEEIAAMFLALAVGWVIVRIGLLKAQESEVISRIAVYICSPCITVSAFQMEISDEKVAGLLLAFVAAALVHGFLILSMRMAKKVFHWKDIERASVIYTNAANLTIPLIAAVLGQDWIFYTSAFIIVQMMLFWSHGMTLIVPGIGMDWKKMLLNPNIIAIGIGLVLFAARIRMPVVIDTAVAGFGDMIGPISMLAIGMLIGEMDLREVFASRRAYLVCLVRLILLHGLVAVCFALAVHSGFHRDLEYILMVVLVATAAPPAVMLTQTSQTYGGDPRYASIINVMGTILCIVTIPLIIAFYEYLVAVL